MSDYVKYRPTYPVQVLEILTKNTGLRPDFFIADVGSGTGISAELFLKNGNTVIGVEPNDSMRTAAENYLKKYSGFKSVKGTSEKTGLAESSVDMIVAAQAFHWFDPLLAKNEFRRILRGNGKVVLLWNDRKLTGTPFLEAYENLLLKFGTDYKKVRHNNIQSSNLESFLRKVESFEVSNNQVFDYAGLLGRLSSSSYVPAKSDPKFHEMEKGLKNLFDRYNQNGYVTMEYTTQIFLNEKAF